MNLISGILSIGAENAVKAYRNRVEPINKIYAKLQDKSDDELRQMVDKLREKLVDTPADGRKEEWDDLYEAFAILKERIRRHDSRIAFDVQLMGAMALYEGKVAELKTGEGKTLVIFFSSFFEALHGKQTHVVSVNDYLTQRDAEEAASIMGPLGISVGRVYNQQPNIEKHIAYKCDIVYGTPSEFGFDYLRDNMVTRAQDRVQTQHAFAIVDEVDSILIDEARTPLIISGAGEEEDETYVRFARAVRGLTLALDEEHKDGDYFIEEDKRQIFATEQGLIKIEERLGYEDLYDRPDTPALVNHLQQALKGEYLFHRDKDYIVINGEVKIVDEFTGRIMEGRRWSDGLHQAIEAKEGVQIQAENQTMATITLQNYFRLYEKLSGTTGTAATETTEFRETYNMDVVTIPTNEPVIRIDEDDRIYRTLDAKFEAIADEIEARHSKGQPLLVGTASVANSERLSSMLRERGIEHEVLNAKQHAREAAIVAQAGRYGAVTIATNMAGRGTDIILGGNVEGLTKSFIKAEFPDYGTSRANDEDAVLPTDEDIDRLKAQAQAIHDEENPKVIAAGGLCVIGSERHDSRRVDNQLRGRSGRQGDPGYSQFYISLEDDLMRLFGTDRMDRISQLMQKTQYPDDVPIQVPMVTKSIENAQRKVEEMNAAMRKNVLDYDDVVNAQRKVIYAERNRILDGENLDSTLQNMIDDVVVDTVPGYCLTKDHENWDMKGICDWYSELTGRYDVAFIEGIGKDANKTVDDLVQAITDSIHEAYDTKKKLIGNNEGFIYVERAAMLKVIDTDWVRHLSQMDYLKVGVGLRGMGQRDPLVEYRHDAYLAFKDLVDEMYNEVLRMVLRMRVQVKYVDDEETEAPKINRFGNVSERTRRALAQAAAQSKIDAEEEIPQAEDSKPSEDEADTPETVAEGTPAAEDVSEETATAAVSDEEMTPAEDKSSVTSEDDMSTSASVEEASESQDTEATEEESDTNKTTDLLAETEPETIPDADDDAAPSEEAVTTTDSDDEPATSEAEGTADVAEPEDEETATETDVFETGVGKVDRHTGTVVGQVDRHTGNVLGYGSTPRTYVKAEHDPFAGVGRNDPCPCGSGKKFKRCHGARR